MGYHTGQKVTFGPWVSALTLTPDQPWQGGRGMFCGTGVMAVSSTATLQMSMDGGSTWFTTYDVNGNACVLLAAEPRNFIVDLPPGTGFQVVLSGAPTAFTGLIVSL